jgi:cellulose synthase/poly-beta-1,6-N-acetylglucosamine synthase-like glycosyltransferase
MIIQILSNLKEEGYLTKGRHPTVAPFFAGANVAFRRSALQEIGGFDPKCMTGEDCDICARLSAAHWELYLRREAIVSHNNPSTLKQLIRQWYGYGRYHPYVFAKHNDRAVEFYVRLKQPLNGERYACLFYRRSPVAVVLFITKLLLFHLMLPGTVTFWLLGWSTIGWMGAGLALLLMLSYAWPDLKRSGIVLGSAFTAIRYTADAALFVGAFIGGLRQKMLYLSATVD